jgi:hypothetical protein
MMPKIAEGDANKVWVIPSEITKALEGLGSSIHEVAGIPKDAQPRKRVDMGPSEPELPRAADPALSGANDAVREAIEAAEAAANPGKPSKSGTDDPLDDPLPDAPPPAGPASPGEPPVQ